MRERDVETAPNSVLDNGSRSVTRLYRSQILWRPYLKVLITKEKLGRPL